MQVDIKKDWPKPEENRWTKLEIRQEMIEGKMMFTVVMGGEVQDSRENLTPTELYNVQVWASDPWYDVPNALMRNLVLKTWSCT